MFGGDTSLIIFKGFMNSEFTNQLITAYFMDMMKYLFITCIQVRINIVVHRLRELHTNGSVSILCATFAPHLVCLIKIYE